MFAFTTGTLPKLTQPHHFDLSFLTPLPAQSLAESPQTASQISSQTTSRTTSLWFHKLPDKLWNLIDEVQIRLEASRASFLSVPATLMPMISESATLRSDQDDGQLEVLILPAADAQFSVQLAIGPMVAGNAIVVVKLIEIDPPQPLAVRLVTLRNSQRQLLVGCMSGQDGCVIFEQLSLGRYFIQVRFNQNIWEIPLVILGGSPLC
jgi:hypothetical protein